MRKLKKINGYFIVKFNDRELREWAGTALGSYGVIDAELYTGSLDVDRSAMEYDGAETLEEAVELARSLESEEDYTGAAPTVTLVRETDTETTEQGPIDAQLLIAGWEAELTEQVRQHHDPDVDARTAVHQLYGFKVALHQLGLLDAEACFVRPDAFGPVAAPADSTEDAHPFDFLHPTTVPTTWRLYELGRALEQSCPENDCVIYRNIFKMTAELDDALDCNSGYARETLWRKFCEFQRELYRLYMDNYAVTTYHAQLRAQKETEPPVDGAAPCMRVLRVTNSGIQIEGQFYSNDRAANHIGSSVYVQKSGDGYTAMTLTGEALGKLTLHAQLRAQKETEPPVDGAAPHMGIDEVASRIYSKSTASEREAFNEAIR